MQRIRESLEFEASQLATEIDRCAAELSRAAQSLARRAGELNTDPADDACAFSCDALCATTHVSQLLQRETQLVARCCGVARALELLHERERQLAASEEQDGGGE